MLQVRLANPEGGADPALEVKADPLLGEEAAGNSEQPRASAGRGKGRGKKGPEGGGERGRIEVVAKGDPYAKGAAADTSGAVRAVRAAPTAGALAGLSKLLAEKNPSAEALEAHARYLAMTGGEPKGQHLARDLASRAADAQPTVNRMLLAAELAEDRNARAAWISGQERRQPRRRRSRRHCRRGAPRPGRVQFPRRNTLLRQAPGARPFEHRGALGAGRAVRRGRDAPLGPGHARGGRQAGASVGGAAALVRPRAQGGGPGDRGRGGRAALRQPSLRRRHLPEAAGRAGGEQARRCLGTAGWSACSSSTPSRSRRSSWRPEASGRWATGLRRATLERRLEICPDDVEGLSALADMHGEAGQKDEQLKLLRQILALGRRRRTSASTSSTSSRPKPRADEALRLGRRAVPGARQAAAGDRRLPPPHAARPHGDHGVPERAREPLPPDGVPAAHRRGRRRRARVRVRVRGRREIVQLRAARVYRENGKVDEAIESGEGAADNPAIAMYTSTRAFYVTSRGSTPGDVVELRYRVEDVTPRNEFADYFGEVVYMQQRRAGLTTPSTCSSRRRAQGHVLLPRCQQRASQRTTRRTTATSHLPLRRQDVPPLTPEPAMPPLPEAARPRPRLDLQDLGRRGALVLGPRARISSTPTTRCAGGSRSITKGLTDDRDKVKAVYDYVVQQDALRRARVRHLRLQAAPLRADASRAAGATAKTRRR